MTEKQLSKLNDLQETIKSLKRDLRALSNGRNISISVSGSYLSLKVPNLEDDIKEFLTTCIENQMTDLQQELDSIILCKEASQESTYKPIPEE